jgi:hypothetical protein
MASTLETLQNIAAELKYHRAVRRHTVDYLAKRYADGEAVTIASLCDDDLDQSGTLLSDVREQARRLRTANLELKGSR